MKTFCLTTLIGLWSIALFGQIPFNCTSDAYLFQYNDVYRVDLASGQSSLIRQNLTKSDMNAAAYNPRDGFLWAALSEPDETVIRFGRDLNVEEYIIPDFIDDASIGDIDRTGKYYVKADGEDYVVVDLNPVAGSYLSVIGKRKLNQNININDWAYNNRDNQLYSVTNNANTLVKINPDSGDVTVLGEVPILSGLSYTYGAVYFDRDGHFYVAANETGTVYKISSVQEIYSGGPIESNLFSFGPASRVNDAARCPTAPIFAEICNNGIDDDGDGLVDCDDPACSNVGICPVFVSSGGNVGGLESNNRLSQQIAERNFERSLFPSPVTVGGPLPSYSVKTATLNRDPELKLTDLIPIGIIQETEALESSPDDLIDITNATEVFSVDYKDGDRNIASVLALKTEGSVYEHNKNICDRLLGAQLHSVSKLFVNGQPFIKSMIFREDGTREFVVSFAVKVDESNSVIEGHWNQDSYSTEGTFYNFQIWAASVDNLLTLSQEILGLVNLHRPILEYELSEEPLVFVQSAEYNHGVLALQVMNNDFSSKLIIEGGKRLTETGTEEEVYIELDIHDQENNIELEIGSLFDLGIRISTNNESVPDDLFVSDGPWGVDDADSQTEVTSYEVFPSNIEKTESNFPIERGVELTATTSEYFSLYRALTPRFEGVDLSHTNNLSFVASGEGILEVTLIKESVSLWEEQLHAELQINGEGRIYHLAANDFSSQSGVNGTWNDISTLVFTQRSPSGTEEEITLMLSDVVFTRGNLSSINPDESNLVTVNPNPVSEYVSVSANNGGILESVAITDLLGQTFYLNTNIPDGQTELEIPLTDAEPGIYTILTTVSGKDIAKKIIIQHQQ